MLNAEIAEMGNTSHTQGPMGRRDWTMLILLGLAIELTKIIMPRQAMRYWRQMRNLVIVRLFSVCILNIVGFNAPSAHEYCCNPVVHLLTNCRQVYLSGSSLATRRCHISKAHYPEYMEYITKNKLANKLPDALLKQRQEQRQKALNHPIFTIPAFKDHLVSMIVSNDLVSRQPGPMRTLLINLFLVY